MYLLLILVGIIFLIPLIVLIFLLTQIKYLEIKQKKKIKNAVLINLLFLLLTIVLFFITRQPMPPNITFHFWGEAGFSYYDECSVIHYLSPFNVRSNIEQHKVYISDQMDKLNKLDYFDGQGTKKWQDSAIVCPAYSVYYISADIFIIMLFINYFYLLIIVFKNRAVRKRKSTSN